MNENKRKIIFLILGLVLCSVFLLFNTVNVIDINDKEILFKGYEWLYGLEVDGEAITKFNIVFALGILLQVLGSFLVLKMYKFGKVMYFFGATIIVFWLFFGCLDFSVFGLSSFLLSSDVTVGFTTVGWWIIAFEALLITYI